MTRICIMKGCYAAAVKRDAYCAPCGHWARVTLADKYYRNHKPPPCPVQPLLPGVSVVGLLQHAIELTEREVGTTCQS